jgi:hypothetical protein
MTLKFTAHYDELVRYTTKHYEHLVEATKNVAATQAQVLSRIVSANMKTPFGLAHRFSEISSPIHFQRRVPVSGYDSYSSWFERKAWERFVSSSPTAWAWSSGTESARKRLPLPEPLLTEFELAIAPWLHTLILHYPQLASGPSYWIVGPRFQDSDSTVELESDDGAYFPPSLWARIAPLLIPSPLCGSHGGFKEWAFATLLHLILEPELTWMSVWSPTLLSELLDSVSELRPLLADSLREGHCENWGLSLAPTTTERLNQIIASRPKIANQQLAILERGALTPWRALWPKLMLCSCWGDGWASLFLPRLTRQLPGVAIQKKGLLATEGVISLPLEGPDSEDPVLAVASHFFEFVESSNDAPLLAHQLKLGGRYDILLTTGGGLYRYALGDSVEVTGWFNQAPRLRFLGKTSGVTDLCGEKLHEGFVVGCIQQLSRDLSLDLSSTTLRPIIEGESRYYEACVPDLDNRQRERVSLELERQLLRNPHYAQCRALRQLQPARVISARRARPRRDKLSTAKESVLIAK